MEPRADNPSCLRWRRSSALLAVHDGHPFSHSGERARVPATCDVPAQAPSARATRRGRVRRTSRQRPAIRRFGASRARKRCTAVRLERSPVRPSMGSSGRRVRRPGSRCGRLHSGSVAAQSRLASCRERRRRKSEARVPRSGGSTGPRPLGSISGSEFPRAESRIDDRGAEDRVGWSHDILALCRASDRAG